MNYINYFKFLNNCIVFIFRYIIIIWIYIEKAFNIKKLCYNTVMSSTSKDAKGLMQWRKV